MLEPAAPGGRSLPVAMAAAAAAAVLGGFNQTVIALGPNLMGKSQALFGVRRVPFL